MSEEQEPEHNPPKAEVAAWLEENDRKRGVTKEGEPEPVPIELSDKAATLLQEESRENQAEAAPPEPPPEAPSNPLFSEDLPTQQKAMQFAMDHASLGSITVNEHERSLYWKAILNEVPIILELEILNGIPVTVQSTSSFDLDVLLAAAKKDVEEKLIPDGMAPFTGRAQTYAAMMQVLKFNGKECKPVLLFDRPYPPIEEAVEMIRKHYQEQHYLHNFPRWNAMIAAVRLFDAKCKICNDNLLNGNFWQPASSA